MLEWTEGACHMIRLLNRTWPGSSGPEYQPHLLLLILSTEDLRILQEGNVGPPTPNPNQGSGWLSHGLGCRTPERIESLGHFRSGMIHYINTWQNILWRLNNRILSNKKLTTKINNGSCLLTDGWYFFFDILVCMLALTLSTEKKQVNPIKFIHGWNITWLACQSTNV